MFFGLLSWSLRGTLKNKKILETTTSHRFLPQCGPSAMQDLPIPVLYQVDELNSVKIRQWTCLRLMGAFCWAVAAVWCWSWVVLNIQFSERMRHRPILTEAPKNTTLLAGETGNLTCIFLSDLSHHIKWKYGLPDEDGIFNSSKVGTILAITYLPCRYVSEPDADFCSKTATV